jgi:hypothetical protein
MQKITAKTARKYSSSALCAAVLISAAISGLFFARTARAAGDTVTHVAISDTVLQPQVERLGLNLGESDYYDSGMLLKNLVARDPGFEGGSYQSVLRCVHADAARCEDDNNGSVWPQDFWRGGSYEWITGPLEGHKGNVTASSAAVHGSKGAVLQLTGGAAHWTIFSTEAPAYLVVRKLMPGDAAAGWWTPQMQGGATLTTEMQDLSPHTAGKQALRMNASGAGQSASVQAYFDSTDGHTFLRLQGRYRLSFRAKAVSGNALHVDLTRLSTPGVRFVGEDLPLQPQWQDLHIDFDAKDAPANAVGSVQLTFTATHATVLLDDVSLEPIDGDPTNKTVFRDAVVDALREYRPGVLRFMASNTGIGNNVANMLAPVGARLRAGYAPSSTEQQDVGYSIPEFLALCVTVHADPWIVVPTGTSEDEMRELVKYLSTPAQGRAAWSATFGRIHLELGNETWNGTYKGETIEYPDDYGHRVSVLFHAARQSAGFDAKRFDLIVGGQSAWPGRNTETLAHTKGADSLSIAPYLLGTTPPYASVDALFSALLAQPEQMLQGGVIAQNIATAKPLAVEVYETNIATGEGATTQATLDAVVPSAGMGVAVLSQMLQSMRAGVRSQCLFEIAQWHYRRGDGLLAPMWGAVVDMGVTNRKRPQFLTIAMANSILHGAMTTTAQSGENPTWNETSGIDGVKLQGAHMLQSFAFHDGAKRAVVLVNLSRSGPLAVDFSGPVQPVGRVSVSQMAAAKITDSNEDAERVKVVSSVQSFVRGQKVTVPPFSVMVLKWSDVR